jgi:HEAT repeat protein
VNLICLVFAEEKLHESPTLAGTRGELLSRCIDGLLGRWGQVRSQGFDPEMGPGESVKLQQRRDLLAKLAWVLSGDNIEPTSFAEKKVTDALTRLSTQSGLDAIGPTPERALDALARDYGVLILKREGLGRTTQYSFLPFIREYLLAWALSQLDDWQAHLSSHLYDPAWQEVLSLLGDVWDQLGREEGPGHDYGTRAEACMSWLLSENTRDLCCRPYLLACRIAVEGQRGLPEPLAEGLADSLVAFCVKTLGYLSPGIIDEARGLLSQVVRPRNVEVLLRVLRDPDEDIRADAISSLGALGRAAGPEVIDALVHVLRDPAEQDDVRGTAIWALCALSQAGSRGTIAVLLKAFNPDILGNPSAYLNLQFGIHQAQSDVLLYGGVSAALEELGRAASPDVIDALLQILRDPDEDEHVRAGAAKTLGAVGQACGTNVIDALRRAKHNDSSASVRMDAGVALMRIEDPELAAAPSLFTTLRQTFGDPEAYLRMRASESIKNLSQAAGRDPVATLLRALCDPAESTRGGAALVAGALGPAATPEVVTALLRTLRDRNASVRKAAIRGLGALAPAGRPDVDTALIWALGDPDRSVRPIAARALHRIASLEKRRAPTERAPRSVRRLHQQWQVQLQSLFPPPPTSWFQKIRRWFGVW